VIGEPTDLARIADQVDWPDHAAEQTVLESRDLPQLGHLGSLVAWLGGVQGSCPPADFGRARVVIFAGDHGVSGAGVTMHGPDHTTKLARKIVAGGAPVNVFAEVAQAGVRLVDIAMAGDVPADISRYKVSRGSGRIDREDAVTDDEVRHAVASGVAVADEEIDAGADLLVAGQLGAGASTAAATLVSVLTDTEPVKVVGRSNGIDDASWMRKAAAVRDARRRAVPVRAHPDRLLGVAGGAHLAAIAGFLLRAAARRTPVVLDDLVVTAGALVAYEASARAVRWWLAGQLTPEPAHRIALTRLGLEPALDLAMATSTGCGALAVVPLFRAAIRAFPAMSQSQLASPNM
jgi:nicotinate-nucleotide--dimethylbenzimidazole phosphoribosyltransferase